MRRCSPRSRAPSRATRRSRSSTPRGVSEETHARAIEPREIKVLNGHTYVRAYCTTREAWRTYRVDRISAVLATSPALVGRPDDDVPNWLTHVGEEGDEIIVVMEPPLRWLFEPLPGARWARVSDGRHAVTFRVADENFVDHLMVRAGPGAVVVTPRYANAGHALAKRMTAQL